jgi:nitrogen fixation-related uncharacterized protein
MNSPTKRIFSSILAAIAKGCLILGGLSFWVGGRMIHAFFNVERFTAEAEGISLAVVLIAVGFLLKTVASGFDDPDETELSDKRQPDDRDS